LDFDHCRCPAFDLIDPAVNDHLQKLNGYTEISPSGKGIRVMLKGKLPVDGTKKGTIEAYQAGRYVTITGNVLDGFATTIEYRQKELDAFYQDVFPEPFDHREDNSSRRDQGAQGEDIPFWRNRLKKAFASKNGAEIKRLWERF